MYECLLDWLFYIFYSIFLYFIFTVCKAVVCVSVLDVSQNFYSHCTLNESAVTFTIYSAKSAASSCCACKYAVIVFLKLAEYWRKPAP
jgi:hypothetical protein